VNNHARRFAILLVLISPALLIAWPQDFHSHVHQNQKAMDAEWPELAKSMDTMHAAMAYIEPSGNGDVDFVRLMLPHHQAAIDMAKAQLMHGTDRQMRRMAQEIMTDQQSEIDLMRMWLKLHAPSSASNYQTPALPTNKEH
jgi:uncharacterized protein (DUF305 family)